MSYQAVDWARHHAPMLRTEKGRPDSTAREILGELAEHSDEHGCNAFPSVLHMRWATGYDERTIQRALNRLEAAGLIERVGVTREGCVRWKLDMSRQRPESDWTDLLAESDRIRAAESARRAKYRNASKEADVSRTQSPGHIDAQSVDNSAVTDAESVRHGRKVPLSRTQSAGVTDAVPPEPSVEPPVNLPGISLGGTLPPNPLRPEPASQSRSDCDEKPASDAGPEPRPSDHPLGKITAAVAEVEEPSEPMTKCPVPTCTGGIVRIKEPPGIAYCPHCRPNVIPIDRSAA